MKLGKHSRWVIVVAGLAVLLILLLTRVDSVQATFSDMHMGVVLLRVESELMQETPAGQYYEGLFYKHSAEIMQITMKYPENDEAIMYALRIFTPALEALMDGRGNQVQITSEQVDVLKAQLDFYVTVGGPTLREDIKKEQQRLQLDHFVGMTMNDAWGFINSTWTPDSMEPPMLVPETDGTWAYYVFNDIYLEYPSKFYIQKSEAENDTIYFIPSSNVPEQWNPCVMKVHVWSVPVAEKDASNSLHRYSPESIVWESIIQKNDFPGVEFISRKPDRLVMNLRAFQYNQEAQLAVDIWVFVNENPQVTDSSTYSEMINQGYEYFQHIVDSLRFQ